MASDTKLAALAYLRRGISIIPLQPRSKKPALKSWKEYQHRLPTEDEVSAWFDEDPQRNLGIVTGTVSGLAVVDFDAAEAVTMAKERGFPSCPTVKTAKGYHAYCSHRPGVGNFQKREDLPGIDLRAEGGYVVAPPSVHENGQRYRWKHGLDERPLPGLPDWLIAKKPKEKQPLKELYSGAQPGERNQALARLAGSWINDGGDLEQITDQALVWNRANKPPLPADEVRRTVQSIWERHQAQDLPVRLTDCRVAECFAREYVSMLRWWPQAEKFLIFDGRRWTTDHPGGAFPLFKTMLGKMYDAARNIQEENQRQNILKGLVSLEGHRRQQTVLTAATVIPEMVIQSHQLDQDPMLLNVTNGTVDLRTGELRPHCAQDFMTRQVSIQYEPEADCPLFLKFLTWAMKGDQELIGYVQRFFGYALTGRTSEQVLLFMHGAGANGKTTLVETLKALVGEYGATARKDLVMVRDNRGPGNDVASLRGSRLVSVSELEETDRIAEAEVKNLTGGDEISCRFLYCEQFSYRPQFKLVLFGNHKPKVQGRDHGIWRRIHLLPFENIIEDAEKDGLLGEKIMQELPGILAWSVRGCLEWQRNGLMPPNKVLAAVQEYRKGEDIFQQWLDDCCITGPEHSARAGDLLDSFIEYSRLKNTTAQKFGRLLKEAGFEQERLFTGRFWGGLGLISEGEQAVNYSPF